VFSEFVSSEWSAIVQVILIDLVLAGDNAIVVGMAAAGVPREDRRKVILWGILAAVVLRIAFALVTLQLLAIIGLTLAGGLLLLWVCWKLYRELAERRQEDEGAALLDGDAPETTGPTKTVRAAIIQVAIADISMSLDNVLAVAGAAGDHTSALVIGLIFSVILMGLAANLIAHLLQRHHWIGFVGLLLIGYVAAAMIWHGALEVAQASGM